MAKRRIGIIMNGVTGRMGSNQHLKRSIAAVRDQGGIMTPSGDVLKPDPILVGRNEEKLKRLAKETGFGNYTTDLDACLADESYEVYFDAQVTSRRAEAVKKAIQAGKAVYCEKPTAESLSEAVELAEEAEKAGVKNGVVQDKLWLPGLRKLRALINEGFFGGIFAVHADFGYWVFSGKSSDRKCQRPSWNYRAEDGGGIIVDMHSHWRYVIDNHFGNVNSVFTFATTHVPERIDEQGRKYECTADDTAYALFRTDENVVCRFTSTWCTRVRREDLFVMQVDGMNGSARVGLRDCWVQHGSETPMAVWNPDMDVPVDYHSQWTKLPDTTTYDNAFKTQWELFLLHVAEDAPFRWTLREGAKGLQLAEKSWESHRKGGWVEVEHL